MQHALPLEGGDHLPQIGCESRVVRCGELEPLGNGVHAWIGRRLVERARLEQAADDRLADAQEVDA